MKKDQPRIAFFPDAFHEVDGIAVFGGHLQAYAKRHDIPFLMVHAGLRDEVVVEGSVTRVQLRRSRVKFSLDRAHDFDLLFLRHYGRVAKLLREFRPDLVQITGPSDVGILGALLAHKLGLPLAAFWQTNLSQYAGLRIAQRLSFLPQTLNKSIAALAQHSSSLAITRFYKIPSLIFAPHEEIVDQLAKATGKPCLRMAHGVDGDTFHPRLRDRVAGPFTIGYVGRLSAEKSVRNLARLEQALRAMGHRNFCIVIAGQGREEQWLRKNLSHAKLRGVLKGKELSRAFANMDVLAFPSETDTFGLVVLEALASGVPAVVTALGGPKYSIQHGETGYVANTFDEFVAAVATLMTRPDILAPMRKAARQYAQLQSWDLAFQEIYRAYADCIEESSAIPTGALTR